MIIVSSCLAGRPCRYDGTAKPNERVMRMVREGVALPVCAEELGGLPTPRKPCEIIGGDGMDVLDGKAYVQTEDGADKTAEFIAGANARACTCKRMRCKKRGFKSKESVLRLRENLQRMLSRRTPSGIRGYGCTA